MDSKIALFAFVVAIAVFLPSASAHRCYACNSVDNRNNECQTLTGIQPSECNSQSLTTLSQVQFLDPIRQIFQVAENQYGINEWQCAKIVITDNNSNSRQYNTTIRTCYPKLDMSFCDQTKSRLQNQRLMVDCNLCSGDACNGASSMSFALLPILGIFALSSYILKA
ncbi:uncharacterized protein LOC117182056 [Belonocnema kinseyi]|uniref:uncharacterized protein LOC117182056 n=1 Tax=Belonocnema kinseyi TaxID=2817044 RepID=UPI00143D0AD2|nr:uncharacterized protein LOC117182056 [Belonocnema kinseyi]